MRYTQHSIKTCTASMPMHCRSRESLQMWNDTENKNAVIPVCKKISSQNCQFMTRLHFIDDTIENLKRDLNIDKEDTVTFRSEIVTTIPEIKKANEGVKIPDMDVNNWKCTHCDSTNPDDDKHNYYPSYCGQSNIPYYKGVVCYNEKKKVEWACPICDGHRFGTYKINKDLEYSVCNICSAMFKYAKKFNKENLGL